MKQLINLYRNAYGGLSRAAWMLALVMFINRSGMMVLPFLSIYVTGPLGFSLEQAGYILGVFGLGSMIGSFTGGWLSDKIGHFKVQYMSLVLGGSLFFFIPLFTTFESLLAIVLIASTVIECLRPANASSVAHYARPENVTRAFSLNRMALNLGFAIGPALGGVLATFSYKWLFIADGSACIAAGVVFFFYFRYKTPHTPAPDKMAAEGLPVSSPYKDVPFLLFVSLCGIFALVFFQFFFTLPLYYRDVYTLSEAKIGGLFAMNGLIVFAVEMILVYKLEKRVTLRNIIVLGSLLNGLAYIMLNFSNSETVLYVSVFILSAAEILAMPFMISFIVRRAGEHRRGTYLGMYSFSYAVAFVIAPFIGTKLITHFGFETLWWVLGMLAFLTAAGFFILIPRLEIKKPEILPEMPATTGIMP